MSGDLLRARILPPGVFGARGAVYLIERNARVARRIWLLLLSGFFEPVLYLASIGIGLGQLVERVEVAPGVEIGYLAFVAPGLLAASAMNGAVYESTNNIFGKLHHAKVYDAVLATPLRPVDIAVGEIAWSQLRGAAYAAAFLGLLAVTGLVASPAALLAVPAAVLIGLAFASAGLACTTYFRSWANLDLVPVVVMPLFLFSGIFFPAEVYPEPLRLLLFASPLYHGVELIRACTMGALDWASLGHATFLLVMAATGLRVATRRIGTLLLR